MHGQIIYILCRDMRRKTLGIRTLQNQCLQSGSILVEGARGTKCVEKVNHLARALRMIGCYQHTESSDTAKKDGLLVSWVEESNVST